MTKKKKHVLFMYTQHTVPSTVSLMKRLLAMFPSEEFETHLLLLSGDRPDKEFQNYVKPIQQYLHLIFTFDCLGFSFCAFDLTPFLNTLWTPYATYLTVPSSQLSKELSCEMNLNITLLCMTRAEEKNIRMYYPEYEDVRTIINPMQNIMPLYQTLYELTKRYPLLP